MEKSGRNFNGVFHKSTPGFYPEVSRFTWSGKLSPDGTQIASLSCSSDATYNDKPTELFIGSVDGSEPIYKNSRRPLFYRGLLLVIFVSKVTS